MSQMLNSLSYDIRRELTIGLNFWNLVLVLAFAWPGNSARAADVESSDYLHRIKPLLKARCYACHGSLKQEAGLRLDTPTAIEKGGDSGPAILSRSGMKSLLVRRVQGLEGERMPPEGAALSSEEIHLIANWIDQGAPAPVEEPLPDPRQHWAYQRPVKVAVPNQTGASITSSAAIDGFILEKLDRLNLKTSRVAHRRALIRRLAVDLTGLLPSTAEVEAFIGDPAPDAYERVVDRMLASPQYAERWARHWMDIWRYSDWDGFNDQIRESQPHLWRWRVWIVESLEADKPYSEMIMEMLAADEMPRPPGGSLAATGFLARNYNKFDRQVTLNNLVEHTSKAFLGLTMNCARCHDHKYDPLSQIEFYRLKAVFQPVGVRIDSLSGNATMRDASLVRAFDATPESQTYFFPRGDEKLAVKTEPLAAGIPEILGLASFQPTKIGVRFDDRFPALRDTAIANVLEVARKTVLKADQQVEQAREQLAIVQNQASNPNRREIDSTASDSQPPKAPLVGFRCDDLSAWKIETGDWKLSTAGAVQKDLRNDFCRLVSVNSLPRNFEVRVRGEILSGDIFRSAGISFDAQQPNRFNAVYVSANAKNPGVESFYRDRGQDIYVPGRHTPVDLRQGVEYDLTIFVRDDLLNVKLNGQLVSALRLQSPREDNSPLILWTLDATARFTINVLPLAPEIPMILPEAFVRTATAVSESPAARLGAAEIAVVVSQLRLHVAKLELSTLESRIAADREVALNMEASVTQTAVEPSASKLAQVARQAEQDLAVANAELQLAEAERDSSIVPTDDPQRLAEAQKKVSAATETLAKLRVPAPNGSSQHTPLGPVYPAFSTGHRLELARALTDRSNPLTARVAVNHIWFRHFGQPLVPTMFDFGLNGKPASHPELLDWLAVEFMESGWKLKPLHKAIVCSQVYRQESRYESTNPGKSLDPENRLLWHMNPRRLEAEAVRDCVLQLAGLLSMEAGGPDLDPNTSEENLRRSIYFRHSKEKRVEFLDIFDAANVTECYRRNETIVPAQALALMNSQMLGNIADRLAERISEQARTGNPERVRDSAFVEMAFIEILGRPATVEERNAVERFCQSLRTSQKSMSEPTVESSLVRVLLNHHDFITVP